MEATTTQATKIGGPYRSSAPIETMCLCTTLRTGLFDEAQVHKLVCSKLCRCSDCCRLRAELAIIGEGLATLRAVR
jgi:hypothetical protein